MKSVKREPAGKVVAVALNFKGVPGAAIEQIEPLCFVMPGSCVRGPDTQVRNPFSPDTPMWGEPELAAVIENIPRNATESQVRNGIRGFTLGNDFTVENIEGRDHHLARSKCADGFCILGNEVICGVDPTDSLIEGLQNDVVVRRGYVRDQIWSWEAVLQWLSTWMRLDKHDVVLMGCPPPAEGQPDLSLLSVNDKYKVRIEGLGEITNAICK